MRMLALIAALLAAPAAAQDAEIAIVQRLFLETPCSKLVQVVVENDARTQDDRHLRTAAYGFIIGRAINSKRLGAAMFDHIKADVARLEAACADKPQASWQSVMRGW